MKKNVEKKIGAPYRCGMLPGIHFWQLEMQRSNILEARTEFHIFWQKLLFFVLIVPQSIAISEIFCNTETLTGQGVW